MSQNLIEFTALLQEKRNREDANSDVSNLSTTSSLSISTLSSDQSKIYVIKYIKYQTLLRIISSVGGNALLI